MTALFCRWVAHWKVMRLLALLRTMHFVSAANGALPVTAAGAAA